MLRFVPVTIVPSAGMRRWMIGSVASTKKLIICVSVLPMPFLAVMLREWEPSANVIVLLRNMHSLQYKTGLFASMLAYNETFFCVVTRREIFGVL